MLFQVTCTMAIERGLAMLDLFKYVFRLLMIIPFSFPAACRIARWTRKLLDEGAVPWKDRV